MRYLLLIFLYTLFNEHIVAVVKAHIDHIERAAHRVRMSEHTRSFAFAVNCLFCACFKRPMVVCLLSYAISSFRHSLMLSSGCEKCIQNFGAFMNSWKGKKNNPNYAKWVWKFVWKNEVSTVVGDERGISCLNPIYSSFPTKIICYYYLFNQRTGYCYYYSENGFIHYDRVNCVHAFHPNELSMNVKTWMCVSYGQCWNPGNCFACTQHMICILKTWIHGDYRISDGETGRGIEMEFGRAFYFLLHACAQTQMR